MKAEHVAPLVGGDMPGPHLQRELNTVAERPHAGDEYNNLIVADEHGIDSERTRNLVLRSLPATPDHLTVTPCLVVFAAARRRPHRARMPQRRTEVSVCRRPPRRPTPHVDYCREQLAAGPVIGRTATLGGGAT